ncbi:MAG TPA: response regulator [Candidatus Paceibacterota bacterium]
MDTTKKRILFIEDEEALRNTFREAFEHDGYAILDAADGEDGLRIAQKELPNLILLDLILPKKSGFDVLKELRSNPATRSIPVIVLTNLEGSEDIEQALAHGATTYLVKANYSLDDIVAKAKSVLEHH